MQNYEKMEKILHTISASKELLDSKYFANFLGFNHISDDNYSEYYFEYIKGIDLSILL